MYDHPVNLSSIVSSFNTQYRRLCEIIDNQYGSSDASEINLFIDVNSIISRILNVQNLFIDNCTLEGCLLATCVHYKNFFKGRYNVNAYIYLIYSDNCPSDNLSIYSDYNRNYIEKLKNNILLFNELNNACQNLSNISLLLPDIMFIHSNEETGVIINDIIEYDKSKLNLIITKDLYLFQMINPMTNILRPFKSNGEDYSLIVNRNNVMTYVFDTGYNDIYSKLPNISSLIFTFTNLKDRNIKSLIRKNVFGRQLVKLINMEFFKYNSELHVDLQQLFNIIYVNSEILRGIPYDLVESRFKVIDIDYQYIKFKNSLNGKILSFKGMQNYFSPAMLEQKCMCLTNEEANMILNLQ